MRARRETGKPPVWPIVISLAIIGGYLGYIYSLKSSGELSPKDFTNTLAIFIGWIVTLLIVYIQLLTTRKDNQNLKKEEIRKSLEIEAFKEINKAVTDFSSSLSTISTKFYLLSGHIECRNDIDTPKIKLEINGYRAKLLEGEHNYTLSVEAHEMIVIRFALLSRCIRSEVYKAYLLIEKFEDCLQEFEVLSIQVAVEVASPDLKKDKKAELKEGCDTIHSKLEAIRFYLQDYRIDLQNTFLGDIFPAKILYHQRDTNIKILSELAVSWVEESNPTFP